MRSETKKRRRSEAGGEGHSWKKATLIIIMMRGRGDIERCGLHIALRIMARKLDGTDGEEGEGREGEGEGGGQVRAPSRSDAIVVPQHFLSAAAVFVCPVSTATADT